MKSPALWRRDGSASTPLARSRSLRTGADEEESARTLLTVMSPPSVPLMADVIFRETTTIAWIPEVTSNALARGRDRETRLGCRFKVSSRRAALAERGAGIRRLRGVGGPITSP